jgi:hypothetical protein
MLWLKPAGANDWLWMRLGTAWLAYSLKPGFSDSLADSALNIVE